MKRSATTTTSSSSSLSPTSSPNYSNNLISLLDADVGCELVSLLDLDAYRALRCLCLGQNDVLSLNAATDRFILLNTRRPRDKPTPKISKVLTALSTEPEMTFGSLANKPAAPKKLSRTLPDPFRSEATRVGLFLPGLQSNIDLSVLLPSTAPSDVVALPDTADDLVSPPRPRANTNAESMFLADYRNNMPPSPTLTYSAAMTPEERRGVQGAAQDLRRMREDSIRAAWQMALQTPDVLAMWTALGEADLARYNAQIAAQTLYRSKILDLGGVLSDSLVRFTDAIGWHGALQKTRGSGCFRTAETTALISVAPASFVGSDNGQLCGERALILTSKATRTYSYQTGGCGCCSPTDQKFLNHASVSLMLPGEGAFRQVFEVAWRSEEISDDAWEQETTSWGRTVDKVAADELEEFVCGSVLPETAQSGVLLRTLMLLSGATNRQELCLLDQMESQPNDAILLADSTHMRDRAHDLLDEEDIGAEQRRWEAVEIGGGLFVARFPSLKEDVTSSASIVKDYQTDVQKSFRMKPLALHAARSLEDSLAVDVPVSSKTRSKSSGVAKKAKVAVTRNLAGLESTLDNWLQGAVDRCDRDKPKVPASYDYWDY